MVTISRDSLVTFLKLFHLIFGFIFALLASALIGCRCNSRTGTNVALDTSSNRKFQWINLASQGVFWGEGANECSAKSNSNESRWEVHI